MDNKGSGYLAKAQNTLHRLADDNVLDEIDGPWTNAVLSFNYTTPFANSKSIFENTSFYNIHGTLKDGNIIFGIDGQNVGDTDMGLPFTKTYRLLSMKPLGYRSLAYPPTDEGHAPTNCIKIYGHSLAQADYSYFQSLFDAVSLYDGITTLVFYYSLYGEGSEAEQEHRIREDLHKRVMHLLTSYGQTLENKDHGKNLVHKLLLEGRLIIKRIDVG